MAQVTITINGRPHVVGCEDGQEPRLMELAATLDSEVRGIASAMGQIGDSRLLVISGLSLVDRLTDVEAELATAKSSQSAAPAPTVDLSDALTRAEDRAKAAEERAQAAEARAAALTSTIEAQAAEATKRIDAIAARLQEA